MEKMQYPRLTDAHLGEIRASVNWQQMFDGLGFKKCPKKSKADDWWAYSPFHDERTPSFHMGPGGLWYDFSIGEGGGALELVQRLQGINCYEAARYVVEQGWSRFAPSSPATHAAEKTQQRSAKAIEQGQHSNPAIRQDLLPLTSYHNYLAERGLSEETCEELGIGFLGQGRSPLRERVIFQLRDARLKSKKSTKKETAIISHIGRAIDDQQPKYLFYEGFHKSAELLGQDRCWLDQTTIEQIKETGFILVTEGPFDWAKCIEAGLLNVVCSMGATLSDTQSYKLKALCDHHCVNEATIAYDRDQAGKEGAIKAAESLSMVGLKGLIFDWEAVLGKHKGKHVHITANIRDLADQSTKQLGWLRQRSLL